MKSFNKAATYAITKAYRLPTQLLFGISLFIIWMLSPSLNLLNAQTVGLQIPKKLSGGSWDIALLHKADRSVRFDLNANIAGTGAQLKIGTSPNRYDLATVDVNGSNVEFVPSSLGLTPGRYYVRVTNSAATTTSAIVSDTRNGLIYSNEVILAVESSSAPAVIGPRGSIITGAPLFEWNEVPGVVAYWIIFSSTPFEIKTDENDDISIEGANIVWQYITSETSALYGSVNESIGTQPDAPPLDPGREYSYTVLNMYDESSPAFASPVFGGVIPMVYQNPNALPKPRLIAPTNEKKVNAAESITFRWSSVEGAVNYSFNLYEVVTQQGVDATIPIYSTTTNNNLLDYPALANLKNARYQWNIVANDGTGGGSTSGNSISTNNAFSFNVASGSFRASAKNTVDNSEISGANILARAISGGVTPTNPFFLQAGSISENLVTGTYEFTAEKAGFESNRVTVTIAEGRESPVPLLLTPLPSFLSGRTLDQNGSALVDVKVELRNTATGEIIENISDNQGIFGLYAEAGSYVINVSKAGYISPASEAIRLLQNQQRNLDTPITLINDQASISGYVLNENSNPIALAKVRIARESDGVVQETRTLDNGFYSFTISSGNWTLEAEKRGFVLDQALRVAVSGGDVQSNRNLRMNGRANQVTGFAREVIQNEDGTTGFAPLENVRITATPASGAPVTAITKRNGQYSLNLKRGSFTLTASIDRYRSDDQLELVLRNGETVSGLDFQLSPNPSNVSGLVKRPDGSLLRDVRVRITGVGEMITSSDGAFSLSVPAGTHTITTTRAGFVQPPSQTVTVTPGQNLTGLSFTLFPNAAVLSGSVTSRGEAVVDAVISARPQNGGADIQTKSNNFGEFTLNLNPGTFIVQTSKSGFVMSEGRQVILSAGQVLRGFTETLVSNTVTLRGAVQASGAPLRDVTITITSSEREGYSETTRTLVNGTFALSLQAGHAYKVSASRVGYRTANSTTSTLVAGAEPQALSLTLNPASAQITGRVLDPNGIALANTRVNLRNTAGELVESSISGNDGRYNLAVAAGNYELNAVRAGYTATAKQLTISPGQNLTGVSFSMAENFAQLKGSIVDENDNPIAGVNVVLTSNSGTAGANAVTGATGVYTLSRLIGGSYNLDIIADGYVDLRAIPVNLTDGQPITLNRSLVSAQGVISGFVRDINDNPIQEATVTATADDGTTFQTISGSDASFTIDGIRPLTYTLEAFKAGYSVQEPATVELTPDSPVSDNITYNALVRSIGQISASVVSDSGVPLSGAVFSISGDNGSASAISASDGQFRLQNLPLGTFNWNLSLEGYTSTSGSISLTESQAQQNLTLNLNENNGVVTGRVRDQQGNSLAIPVEVRLIFGANFRSQRTDAEGNFRFEALPKNTEYLLETSVQGDGLIDTELRFNYPSTTDIFETDGDLVIRFNNNTISGNTGIDGVTLQLLDSEGTLLDTQLSQDDGSYQFRFVPAGSYEVIASRQGYVFNPTSRNIADLGYDQTRTADFSAQSNAGNINIQVVDDGANPLNEVDLFLTDAENTLVLSGRTASTGIFVFEELPAGKSYIISASKNGFTADPPQLETALNAGQNITLNITLRANNASISGQVLRSDNNQPLANARVQLVNEEVGTSEQLTTNGGGTFNAGGIQAGNYTLVASTQGFISDTLRGQRVDPGQNLSGINLSLAPSSLNTVSGKVLYKGSGLIGVSVELSGIISATTQTNANGDFSISNFPILTGAEDTTSIVATYTFGSYVESRIVAVPSTSAGTNLELAQIEIPSGRLSGIVTNGVSPIGGADVTITQTGTGTVIQLETNLEGQFETGENLRRGVYQMSVNAPNILLPSRARNVELVSDSEQEESLFRLPYRFRNQTEITATAPAEFKISITSGYSADGIEAKLFYRQEQDTDFNSVSFSLEGDTLSAIMPAPGGTDPLTYYVRVSDNQNPESFESAQFTVNPLPVDILSAITLSPSPEGLLLRSGDSYKFNIGIRDGVNRSMTAQFTGSGAEGTLTVTAANQALAVNSTEATPSFVFEAPSTASTIPLTLTAGFNGQVFTRRINLQIAEVNLSTVQVSRPARSISNAESAVFSYRAEDTDGTQVLLGSSGVWQINSLSVRAQNANPIEESIEKILASGRALNNSDALGSISQEGIFTPNANTIGQFNVAYVDASSGLTAMSEPVGLVAEITDDAAIQLSNGEGFILDIPAGSLSPNTQVNLQYRKPETPKKYVVAKGTDLSLITSDEIFVVGYSGGEPESAVSITLPEPLGMVLNDGNRTVGYFDQLDLQWELFNTSLTGTGFTGTGITKLGQFAVLVENQPLGLEMVRILPNPFSPMVAPVKIGYVLTSDAPPAFVTIKIFNMRGQLIRTLLDEDPQQPGRYGSRSSLKEISWDGLTDEGLMARNGRYVLQIVARDTKNEVETLKTIVLVK